MTTGEAWQFVTLEKNELTVDADRYYITDLGKVMGILAAIMT